MLYLWIKALHLVAIVCWFAGLFYLPRLFVYHAMSSDLPSRERFCIMERKLYRGIMTPSLIATVGLGLWMLHLNPALLASAWLHLKLSLVLLLIGYHLLCGVEMRRFAENRNRRGHVFYRWFNEAPVLFLLAVVILAVVKPPLWS
jgi:putative membrane protein